MNPFGKAEQDKRKLKGALKKISTILENIAPGQFEEEIKIGTKLRIVNNILEHNFKTNITVTVIFLKKFDYVYYTNYAEAFHKKDLPYPNFIFECISDDKLENKNSWDVCIYEVEIIEI